MYLGDDNMHTSKRRKLLTPANSITEYSGLFCLQRTSRRGHPEQRRGTERVKESSRWYREGRGNPQGCKFTEFSSTENMEMHLSDMLPLLSNFQLLGYMQEEMSWDKVLRSSITHRVWNIPFTLTIFDITKQLNFWIIIFKLSFNFPFSPDSFKSLCRWRSNVGTCNSIL